MARTNERPDNKNPEYQCRALSIPMGVVQLVKKEVITKTEAWMASIIDALVQCRGEGCWASNRFLAEEMVLNERQVRNILAKLKRLGIVKEKLINGQRYLETSWSRSAERTYTRGATDCHPPGNGLPPPRQRIATNKDNRIKTIEDEAPPPETGGRDTPLGIFPKSHESNGHSPKGKVTAAQPLSMQIAIRLRAIVVDVFHIANPWSKVKWAGEIAIAERRYGAERLEKVFDWYEQNADRQKELGLPRVKSAANFKNTFDWIEEKMEKTDWNEGAIGM